MSLLQQLTNLNAGLAVFPIKLCQAGIHDVVTKQRILELRCLLF